ncbi:MAG: hypothetical protein ACRDM7_02475 [Thermoleophilaceae bacterium]
MRGRLPTAIRTPLGVAAVGGLLALWMTLALRSITPPIEFNAGLGYDGQHYAAMVEAMRGGRGPVLAERPHYAYRPLPVAIVAVSGLDVIPGFLLMNALSLVLAGAILAAIVRRYAGGVLLPVTAVVWWAALPGSIRYSLYYPVLVDGIGLFLLFALVYAVVARLPWLFALLIGPAMLARENLIVLVPMLWLALLPTGLWRATMWSAVPGALALAAFLWVRIAPPIPPAEPFDAVFEARQNLEWFFGNVNDRALRFASAWILALGLFAVVPLSTWRAAVSFLRRELAWAYYLATTVALIVVIGGDYDRYFLYLVPALAVLSFGATTTARLWRSSLVLALATGAHLLLSRFAWPVGGTEEAYLAYSVATMDVPSLLALLSAGAVVAAAASAILFVARSTDRNGPLRAV